MLLKGNGWLLLLAGSLFLFYFLKDIGWLLLLAGSAPRSKTEMEAVDGTCLHGITGTNEKSNNNNNNKTLQIIHIFWKPVIALMKHLPGSKADDEAICSSSY